MSSSGFKDASGKAVTSSRIRRELTSTKVPFYVWSTPLHARAFLRVEPQSDGCRLGLFIDFVSLHPMVYWIFPGERLGLQSNRVLENGYMDALLDPKFLPH